jgi:hypothetical protein
LAITVADSHAAAPARPGTGRRAGPGNSWLGIVSFAVGIAASLADCFCLGVATLGAGLPQLHLLPGAGVGAAGLLGIALSFVGLTFGIIGLFRTRRSRVAAVVGVAINGLLFLGMGGIVVLGLCLVAYTRNFRPIP